MEAVTRVQAGANGGLDWVVAVKAGRALWLEATELADRCSRLRTEGQKVKGNYSITRRFCSSAGEPGAGQEGKKCSACSKLQLPSTEIPPLLSLCSCCSLCWNALPISTCLTPPHSSGLHLNTASPNKHSLNCPTHNPSQFLWAGAVPCVYLHYLI